MGKKIGILCILLGILCLAASAGLILFNRMEAAAAETASGAMLEIVRQQVPDRPSQPVPVLATSQQTPREMPAVELDGYPCIGILSIPVLELELPVLENWDYEKLRKAPCSYHGSVYGPDFVIAAHNYPAHFGNLHQLLEGDLILFTDLTGQTHIYQVVLVETLPPTATAEMITSGFDLSLYTCTPGGGSRVTARCSRVNP